MTFPAKAVKKPQRAWCSRRSASRRARRPEICHAGLPLKRNPLPFTARC